MSDVVNPQEEAIPLAAATTGNHPSCSRPKRCSSPDDDDLLVKKSKKQQPPKKKSKKQQLFNSPASTSPRPSTSPVLRRTISDPLPYAQLFKKLRDGTKELTNFLEQIPPSEIVPQEGQTQVISETDAPNALLHYHQDGEEDLEANNSDESVSVDKTGEYLNIHVRCPCGKRHPFILYQGSCFYKLIVTPR